MTIDTNLNITRSSDISELPDLSTLDQESINLLMRKVSDDMREISSGMRECTRKLDEINQCIILLYN
jgi:hypothetical protein